MSRICIIAAIFTLDRFIHLGIAVPILYGVPLVITGLVSSRRDTILTLAGTVLLTWIGAALSPGDVTPEVLTDRSLVTGLLLSIGWLQLRQHSLEEKLAETQQARNLSQERLRLAQTAEAFGTFDWDIPSSCIIWSPETERIWGLPIGGFEATYEHWRRLVHPHDVDEAERRARLALEQPDAPYSYDHRIVRPDGTIRWIHSQALTVRDATGRPIRMVGVNTDITPRKVEEAARVVSARRRSLLADTAELLLQSTAPQEVLREICRRVMTELECEFCFNYLMDPPTQRLRLNVCFGVPEEERARIAWLNLGEAVCGAVALKGQAIVAEHLTQTEDAATQLVRSYGVAAYACHPLLIRNRVMGTLSFGTKTKASFPDDELGLMKAVADQVALLLDRVHAEDALRASEEQLRLFIQQAPAAIAMFDRKMRYLAASDRWYADYGLAGNVIGRSHYDVFPEIPDRWKAIHRRGLAGEVVRADDDPFARADGSMQWVQWEVRPWFREGDIGGITIMTEDVTTRVRAVQKLVDSETKLRNILMETKTGIWEWAVQSGQFVWSPQVYAMLGYSTSDFEPTYESWSSRIHPEDRSATEEAVRRAMTDQGEYHRQYRCVWSDKTVHWIEAQGTFRYDPGGQCERMVGLMRDITQAKHADDTIRQQHTQLKNLSVRLMQAQDDECRRISRELHDDHMQRFAALALNLHFLSTSLPRPMEEVKAAIIQQARTVEEMCNALRQLAHELHPALLTHVGLVASVTAHVREFEQKTRIKTTFDMVDDSLSNTLSDEQALCFFRVVQESLQNVRKYAKARSVQIRLMHTPRGVGLCIHDDGVGFIVGGQSARGRSGLGLISLRERLEAMDGTFHVKSKPGCGTEVHAWIPWELVKAQDQVGVGH